MAKKSKPFTLADLLLPYQRQFVNAPQRKKLWLASRQIGKSFTIAYLMCQKVLQAPGTVGLCISTGARAASELLKKCKLMAEAVKIMSQGRITYSYNAERIQFSNGSEIISLPSNPDGLRGFTAAIICIDECAFIPFVDECWQAILPTLTRNQTSELVVCSTPAGQSGLFFDLYFQADPSWYVQTTTIEDAVRLGLKIDLDALRQTVSDPEIWQQEYMCRFSKSFGVMVDTDLLEFYDQLPASKTYYAGIDVGRTNDSTAIAIIKQDKDIYFLEDIVQLRNMEYSEQLKVVKDLYDHYKFTSGYIDQTGIGSAFSEQVTKTVNSKLIGLQITGSNKTPMYEKVRSLIFDHKIKFNPEHKTLLKQDFTNVHRIVTETGNVKFEAGRDSNGHSDVVSALCLGIKSASDHPSSFDYPRTHTTYSPFGARTHTFSRF